VELAPDAPDKLDQAALDRHVNVLVVGREREAALPELPRDGVQAGEQLVAFLLRDDGDRSEHRGMRARLRDVVTPQAPVEVQ
jgi:hypothetical protein